MFIGNNIGSNQMVSDADTLLFLSPVLEGGSYEHWSWNKDLSFKKGLSVSEQGASQLLMLLFHLSCFSF